jgi:hypothetical protein
MARMLCRRGRGAQWSATAELASDQCLCSDTKEARRVVSATAQHIEHTKASRLLAVAIAKKIAAARFVGAYP